MDELKQQDEEHKLNQETSAAGKSVSNVDPRSWEDDEPEIPEEPELLEGAIEIDGFNENGEPKSLEELLKVAV